MKLFKIILLLLIILPSFTTALVVTNLTGLPVVTNITVNSSSRIENITFTQRPYIINATLNTRNYNSSIINYRQNGTNTPNCDSAVLNCASSWDGNPSSYTEFTTSGVWKYITIEYTNFQNQTRTNLTTIASSPPTGSMTLDCYNYNLATWVSMIAQQQGTTTEKTIPSECLSGSTITTRIGLMYNLGGSSYLYDQNIKYFYPYNVTVNNLSIFTGIQNETTFTLTDFKTQAQTLNNTIMYFNFSTLMRTLLETNISIGYIYNTTINLTTKDNSSLLFLNPLCTYNGNTFYPKTYLLNYTSSLVNLINCSLNGYSEYSTIITPENLTQIHYMQPQLITLNFSSVTDVKVSFLTNQTQSYNTSLLTLNLTDLSIPISVIYFNNYTQKYEIWSTDLIGVNLYKELLVNESLTSDKTIRVTDGIKNLENARVEVHQNSITSNIVWGSLTDGSGKTTVKLNPNKAYYICAYKTGYSHGSVSCKHVALTDITSTTSLVLTLISNTDTPINVSTIIQSTNNQTSYRINITITEIQTPSNNEKTQVFFIIIILALIIGLAFEKKVSGTGNLVFVLILVIFGQYSPVLRIIAFLYGAWIIFWWWRNRT